jgi:hypothetical protein
MVMVRLEYVTRYVLEVSPGDYLEYVGIEYGLDHGSTKDLRYALRFKTPAEARGYVRRVGLGGGMKVRAVRVQVEQVELV